MPSFDQIVQENLERGLYLTQRDALIAVVRDPRCEPRHSRVLAEIIARMNVKTGVAYPGHRSLSRDTKTLPTGQIYDEGGYTERGVGKTIQELTKFGYLVQTQRAPEHGGRALSHYTLARPSVEDLQREITAHIESIRAKQPSRFLAQLLPDTDEHTVAVPVDDTSEGVVNGPPGGTNEGVASASGDTCVGGATNEGVANRYTPVMDAGYTYVAPPVTSNGTSTKKESPSTEGLPHDPEFDAFWAAYPNGRKKGKAAVFDLFKKITTGAHKKLRASAATLIDGARRYAATSPDPEYVPLPATWLNQGRWMDDTPAATAPRQWWQDPAKVAAIDDERWRDGIDQNAGQLWPIDKLGPPPGSPNCVVPATIVAELRLTEIFTSGGIRRR